VFAVLPAQNLSVHTSSMAKGPSLKSTEVRMKGLLATIALRRVLSWYFREVYGHHEGPGVLPFYCDPTRVGTFAIEPGELVVGGDDAVFRLFVTLSMYQALRDVVIMRRQLAMPLSSMRVLADAQFLHQSVMANLCSALRTGKTFEADCDVSKRAGIVDCGMWASASCHVKDATRAFNRMGDMGKLPTSAWLRFWKDGALEKLLAKVHSEEASPLKRADLLVQRFAQVHRVGRKLATMFVSALSTPALSPGLTPWFPEIDGNGLVVVDTNVARAVDAFRPVGAAKSYEARVQWLVGQARKIDLREFEPMVPSYSPRLVQQALYAFGSKSNRHERGDRCSAMRGECGECVPSVCPFGRSRRMGER